MTLLRLVNRLIAQAWNPMGTIAAMVLPASALSQGRTLAPEPAGRFTQFQVSRAPASPQSIAIDTSGRLWVSLAGSNTIARVSGQLGTARVQLTEYPIPTPGAFPQGIAIGGDGSVWFAELRGGRIGRLDPVSGIVREYTLPDPEGGPVWIAIDPDDNVWFTQARGGRIGVLNASTGGIREFRIPTEGAVPLTIRRAPDGMLWFPEHEGNKIGRLDPVTGEMTEFPIPTPGSGPADVAIASDGSVWFTELDGDKIGRLDPATGRIREFPLVTRVDPAAKTRSREVGKSGPAILAWGPDGALWFTAMYGHQLGRIDTQTFTISTVPLPNRTAGLVQRPAVTDADDNRPASAQGDGPAGLIAGPDGTLWYTAMYGNKLGRYEPVRR